MKFICTIFLIILFVPLRAQSLSPMVFSTAGTELSNGTNSFTWTLGELLTSSNNLSLGFQQVNVFVTAIEVEKKNELSINVFPNPTIDIIQLQFSKVVKNFIITIYSKDGKQVYLEKKSSESLCKINLSSFPNGTYSLKLSGDISAHYEVVKLN
jgi:hypothetical protein